jgi:hypothetical protein
MSYALRTAVAAIKSITGVRLRALVVCLQTLINGGSWSKITCRTDLYVLSLSIHR